MDLGKRRKKYLVMKKIMTKMMTTLCVMGCMAAISAPITAHAEPTWNADLYRATGIFSESRVQQEIENMRSNGWYVINYGVTLPPYTDSTEKDTTSDTAPVNEAANGHTYTTTSIEDATCTEAGKLVKTCDACGDVQEETIEALGHVEGEPTTKVEPTLFTDGVEVVTCDTCGEELSSTVLPAKLPHPIYWIVGIISLVVLAVVFCVSFIVIKKRKQNSLEE